MADFPRGFPRRGEIYWAPVNKVRPVVVVSHDTGNKFSSHIVVATLTTNPRGGGLPMNVELPTNDPLPNASVILGRSLYTLAKADLKGFRAQLSAPQMDELDDALRAALAL